jgi:hypothetical protein
MIAGMSTATVSPRPAHPIPAPRATAPARQPRLADFIAAMADAAEQHNTTQAHATATTLRLIATFVPDGSLSVFVGTVGLLPNFVPIPDPEGRGRELAFWYRCIATAQVWFALDISVRADVRCVGVWEEIARGFRRLSEQSAPDEVARRELADVATTYEVEVALLREYFGS